MSVNEELEAVTNEGDEMSQVLIVEDIPANQIIMSKALTKVGGYEVMVTEDVEQVLALTQAGQVGLVVMDINLKNSFYQGRGVDGLEITGILKSDPITRDIPVLLASAHAVNGKGARLCAQSGADGYIGKPFELHAFVGHVQQLLAKCS